MRNISVWILLTLLIAATTVSISGQDEEWVCTHYVSPEGSDSASGDQDHPWRTLQHAADTAPGAATVCVLPGDYVPEEGGLQFTTASMDHPLNLIAPEGATIHGEVTIAPGVSDLRLEGFTVTDYPIWGITLVGDNSRIVLTGLDVSGGEAGIHFTIGYSGEDPEYGPVAKITLRDSLIHDTEFTAVDCTPGPCDNMHFQNLEIYGAGMTGEASYGADGLAVERGQNILVENCYIHDNGGDGIDLNSRDATLETDSGEVLVENNVVANNLRNGIKLWRGGIATNNIVWNSGEDNLVLVTGSRYMILNNTFANRTGYGYLAVLGDEVAPGETSVLMVNNIFYNDNPEMGGTLVYVAGGVQFEADYNLYYNPFREEDVICMADDLCVSGEDINEGDWFAQSGQGEHSLYADPLFVDAAGGDFHLRDGSPALGAGSPVYGADLGAPILPPRRQT